MAYYRECPTCGAHLDPGERCMECAEKARERSAGEGGAGPDKIVLEWKTPPRAAATPQRLLAGAFAIQGTPTRCLRVRHPRRCAESAQR